LKIDLGSYSNLQSRSIRRTVVGGQLIGATNDIYVLSKDSAPLGRSADRTVAPSEPTVRRIRLLKPRSHCEGTMKISMAFLVVSSVACAKVDFSRIRFRRQSRSVSIVKKAAEAREVNVGGQTMITLRSTELSFSLPNVSIFQARLIHQAGLGLAITRFSVVV
jgi:hypothetical protein